MGNGNCCEHRSEPATPAKESARQRRKELPKKKDSTDEEDSSDEAEEVTKHTTPFKVS